MLIHRRSLLGAALFSVAAGAEPPNPPPPAPQAVPRDGRISFRVVRKGSDIGSHILTFTPVANGLDIRIAVRIAVSLGPITLFRYTLDGVEQWRDGQVVRVAARTDDDGTHDSMQAMRDRQGLWVSGSKAKRYLAPPDALPATHWNEAELRGPWINPQDGRLLRPTITPLGPGPVEIGPNHDATEQRFDVAGDVRMQIWYSQVHRWAGLTFTAHDGSLIRYEQS